MSVKSPHTTQLELVEIGASPSGYFGTLWWEKERRRVRIHLGNNPADLKAGDILEYDGPLKGGSALEFTVIRKGNSSSFSANLIATFSDAHRGRLQRLESVESPATAPKRGLMSDFAHSIKSKGKMGSRIASST